VELDSITARIAQYLYPGADIQQKGFEKTDTPDSFFALDPRDERDATLEFAPTVPLPHPPFFHSSRPEHPDAEDTAYQPDEDTAEQTPPPAGEDAKPEGRRLLGIRFHKSGQVFFYPDSEHTVRKGSKVLVQLEHGPALGEVVSILDAGKVLSGASLCAEGKVLGLALAQDIARHTENRILADEAEAFCKTCIRQRNLDMKLVHVEVLHDHSKIIFYFTAPTRIDFRELVKDLVRNYRTRIELRQIGVRHESQMIGGLGNCGMVCCCHLYLRKFAPVTIKMAKEQNLFLNPSKLSGMCGRLLCCLSFEQGNYEEFNRRCPKIGKKYATASKGLVKVLRANMFTRKIALQNEAGEESEVLLEEWEALEPRRAEAQHGDHNPVGPRAAGGDARRARNSRETRPGGGGTRYPADGDETDDLSALEDPPQERDRRGARPPDTHRQQRRGRKE
jgi:cell fate regulator YaaT (PSP1 superfamily)